MGWLDRILGGGADDSPDDAARNREPADLVFEPAGPFEIARCPGADALGHLNRLREEGREAGFTVVLLGTDDDVEMLAETRGFLEAGPEELIPKAAGLDLDEWLRERGQEDPEAEVLDEGEWPEETPEPGQISAHLDVLTRQPEPVVCLARVPTANSWELPIRIGMGGWNECPEPVVLAAFARRWQLRYGAELVSLTHDVMEFSVSDPPTTREAALELAREQYLVCADIVEQGCGSVAGLAATLLEANYWYFWWD